MKKVHCDSSVKALSMDNEAYYRKQAACYRSSAAYTKMKRLYIIMFSILLMSCNDTNHAVVKVDYELSSNIKRFTFVN